MIDYKTMRAVIPKGLKDYLGVTVIRGNQTAAAPPYPYASYNVTTVAGANNGTYQQHADGIDRIMVRSIWSFSFLSDDYDESMALAIKAREWFLYSGRTYLSEHGITVQSAADIINRDNILTVEYERKNGFDVVFYAFDEVESLTEANGIIESAEITHETTD